MKSRLFKIIIKTTFVSSILTLFFTFIIQMINSDREIKNCYMPFFNELLSFFLVWLLSFSLLPIFLNLYKNIRNSFLKSFLSFYSLLIIFTIYFVFDETFEFRENPIYFISVFLPYYLILSYNFLAWRKFLKE